MATTVTISPHRRTPAVQASQLRSPFTNIYTNSRTVLRDVVQTSNTVCPTQTSTVVPYGHPEPNYRFIGSAGYGGCHINDKAPFSLWNDHARSFLTPTAEQKNWIFAKYNATALNMQHPFIIITTDSPPQPISLTVGCVDTIFILPGTQPFLKVSGISPYTNPRLADPCPQVRWPRFSHPSKSQIAKTVEALSTLMALKAVLFLPLNNVVELQDGDGRIYEPRSLPGVVGTRATTYHRSGEPFMEAMKSLGRERGRDPLEIAKWLDDGYVVPQDRHDYLVSSGILTPGVRAETGLLPIAGPFPGPDSSTTAGVFLRRGTQTRLTVAHHGFLNSREVYHPDPWQGNMIGSIEDGERFPELGVALVKLNPAYLTRISNSPNFQAETPRRLVETDGIVQGDWYEVDGMSTGLISLMNVGIAARSPIRPLGHPAFDFSKWTIDSVARIFGATNEQMRDGVCGAPIVHIGTGGVARFFHLGNGGWAESATLDDLVTLGWQVM